MPGQHEIKRTAEGINVAPGIGVPVENLLRRHETGTADEMPGMDILRLRRRFGQTEIPKAQVVQQPVGMLKAIIDAKTNRILGVHLFCEESHEMINLAKLAIDNDLPYMELRDMIFTHPTMSEGFNDLFASIR